MNRKTLAVFLAALLVMGSLYIASATYGTADDPLITLSYLEEVLTPSLIAQLETKVAESAAKYKDEVKSDLLNELKNATGSGGAASEFAVVQIFAGQTITAATGSIEFLPRRGSFTCVDPVGEMIVNITTGADTGGGAALTLQNLYLIPRADGRGFTCTSAEGWVMVRGGYLLSGDAPALEEDTVDDATADDVDDTGE